MGSLWKGSVTDRSIWGEKKSNKRRHCIRTSENKQAKENKGKKEGEDKSALSSGKEKRR